MDVCSIVPFLQLLFTFLYVEVKTLYRLTPTTPRPPVPPSVDGGTYHVSAPRLSKGVPGPTVTDTDGRGGDRSLSKP